MIEDIYLEVTTDGSGDGTATGKSITGRLVAVEWIDGDLADGNDGDVKFETPSGASVTVFDKDNLDDDATYYPRTPAQDNTGTDVTYDGTREIYIPFFVTGKPTLTVANGGDTKTGGCVLYIEK